MKKKFMICCMAIITSMGMHAQGKTVELHWDIPKTDQHRFEVPTVKYDKDEVTISADTIIYNAHIIIKDATGNTIYDKKKMINPAETTLSIPEEYQNDKFTIEIYYKDKYVYGYFE
ncbi:DUF3244 domain-containing protein [Prevotella sp. MGM1]|uniref:DUF3244 domain-containing protein n=1 Tax=Prevotella sp. MGM1 TaxID=2033405 RepID=UPI0011B04A57|nr:DUF3244 domain-containing protein [Prevotella sp. MGM1]